MKKHAARSVVLLAWIALAQPALAQPDGEYPHGEFAGDCATCHPEGSATKAAPSEAFRDQEHPFPLRQAHDLPRCQACHRTLDFTQADRACVSCHQDVHTGELGTDCARCHIPRTFIDRSRMQEQHHATRFPLRGSHRALDCEDCHVMQPQGALRWVNTPVDCVACHGAAYDATDDPDHAAAGYPRECDRCHVPTVWEAARVDHSEFTDPCVTCHQDDYNATRDPNHTAAGFPTTCEDCHRAGGDWNDAEFEHDAFPIYSGEHSGRWDDCSTCHTNPSNYAVFSCFGCHPHSDREETDDDHDGVPGYAYDSARCYGCHPRGEE